MKTLQCSTADSGRTIHGMVYNAMKLFMEINPQLFDECSHDYTEMQNTAEQRNQARKSKWDQLAQQANQRRNNQATPTIPTTNTKGQKATLPMRIDEVDPITQDSQKRLDALRLQDEGVNPPRPAMPEPLRPRHDRNHSGSGAATPPVTSRQNSSPAVPRAG